MTYTGDLLIKLIFLYIYIIYPRLLINVNTKYKVVDVKQLINSIKFNMVNKYL